MNPFLVILHLARHTCVHACSFFGLIPRSGVVRAPAAAVSGFGYQGCVGPTVLGERPVPVQPYLSCTLGFSAGTRVGFSPEHRKEVPLGLSAGSLST